MGARAICMATAAASDIASVSTDEDIRKKAHARDVLLTPIAKAYSSDIGVSTASTSLQVFGGMGFVEETGAAQHYRDSRIAPIYEGTNGIQAIDLVGRKLRRDGGEAMRDLMAELDGIAEMAGSSEKSQQLSLKHGIKSLREATDILLSADELDVLSVATNYLQMAGRVISGALLLKAALNGQRANDPLADNMMSLARYHMQVIQPEAHAHLDFMRSGADTIFDLPMENLADL